MDDACTIIAGNVRASLVVVGIGLVIVGGSGPDSIGIVSIFGIVTLLIGAVGQFLLGFWNFTIGLVMLPTGAVFLITALLLPGSSDT